ncbi:MAG: hypothetical protein OXG27_11055 [Chloroflexi bacterium]|nr:hypothetical protein [Chloroflexota bacterium]
MRFVIGLLLGLLIGAVLTILATGNAGRALQEQIREQTERERASRSGDRAPSGRGLG